MPFSISRSITGSSGVTNVFANTASSADENSFQEISFSNTNVYVSHIPLEVDDDLLRSVFSPFGEIESSVVMRDIFSGTSRGIAFVQFKEEAAALLAIDRMHHTQLMGKTISVQPAKKFTKGSATSRVFIRNIPKGISQDQISDLFMRYGEITNITMHTDSVRTDGTAKPLPLSNGLFENFQDSKVICFITFSRTEDAAAAAAAVHNTLPFAQCGGVPLLTKVVVENLPPKRDRKGVTGNPPPVLTATVSVASTVPSTTSALTFPTIDSSMQAAPIVPAQAVSNNPFIPSLAMNSQPLPATVVLNNPAPFNSQAPSLHQSANIPHAMNGIVFAQQSHILMTPTNPTAPSFHPHMQQGSMHSTYSYSIQSQVPGNQFQALPSTPQSFAALGGQAAFLQMPQTSMMTHQGGIHNQQVGPGVMLQHNGGPLQQQQQQHGIGQQPQQYSFSYAPPSSAVGMSIFNVANNVQSFTQVSSQHQPTGSNNVLFFI